MCVCVCVCAELSKEAASKFDLAKEEEITKTTVISVIQNPIAMLEIT